MPSHGPRWIVANLALEAGYARLAAAARRREAAQPWRLPSPRDPRFAPRPAVLRRASALGSLMRVFAGPGDVLWTPRPVAPARLPGPPLPALRSGPLPPGLAPVIAWGEGMELHGVDVSQEVLPAALAAAFRANDRRRWLGWARERGWGAPGARVIADLDELGGREAGPWLVKAPFSASGRLRVRGEGPPTAPQRATLERLLQLFGSLVREPWLPRVGDFGYLGRVGAEVELLGGHVLETDRRGAFAGVRLRPPPWEEELRETAQAVGERLRADGYRGPFGIDALAWGDPPRLVRLVEVNARHSFGHLARAWQVRRGGGGLFVGARVPAGEVPLLLPGEDGAAAWLSGASAARVRPTRGRARR